MNSIKPYVYIASPYSKGDQALNVRSAMATFDFLLTKGSCIPVCPLWAHFQHLTFPHHYATWLSYSLSIAKLCDICLRVPVRYTELHYFQQDSPGADFEISHFEKHGKPVVYSLLELDSLLRTWPQA